MELLKFKPILIQKIWGGDKICAFKGLSTNKSQIGESLEISDLEGDTSIINGGEYNNMSLSQLLKEKKGQLVGKHIYKLYKSTFPLLFKFIDATQNLSIQVHPNDDKAHEMGLPNGKTEMWYVLEANKNASIFLGFKNDTNKEEILKAIKNNDIRKNIKSFNISAGDCFFIPAGCIHALCGGSFVVEIQQSSNTTFRVFDYNRTGLDGKPRELHIEKSLECFNFHAQKNSQKIYHIKKNEAILLTDCPYFTTNLLNINTNIHLDYSKRDSFVVLIITKGEATINNTKGSIINIRKGETLLIPADNTHLTITPITKEIKLLETYIE